MSEDACIKNGFQHHVPAAGPGKLGGKRTAEYYPAGNIKKVRKCPEADGGEIRRQSPGLFIEDQNKGK
ncbi:MAG: hypothetical protein IJL98_07150 [Lachnospiraceae bacterium]|nr:hypothetical protein [Lachnospiraceae bacterium]